jgi:hypothetical protein
MRLKETLTCTNKISKFHKHTQDMIASTEEFVVHAERGNTRQSELTFQHCTGTREFTIILQYDIFCQSRLSSRIGTLTGAIVLGFNNLPYLGGDRDVLLISLNATHQTPMYLKTGGPS